MRFTLYIFKGLHYAFIVAVLAERSQSTYHLIALIIALFLIAYTYKHTPIKKVTYTFSDALNVVFVLLGALATFALSVETSLNTVFVASALGLLGAFIPKHKLLKEAPAALYCGTFIGMTSTFLVANGYLFIAFAGAFGGLVYIIAKPFLNGFGGKLGTIAFGGVAFATLFIYLTNLVY